jgi:hypothetical protein
LGIEDWEKQKARKSANWQVSGPSYRHTRCHSLAFF